MKCPFCGSTLVAGSYCPSCNRHGMRIDNFVACEVGKPVDVGWGTIVLNENDTVTRSCHSCRATTTSRVYENGEVARVPFVHDDGCPMVERMLRGEPPSFLCPLCGFRSYNPNDIAMRYCGGCHMFVDDLR